MLKSVLKMDKEDKSGLAQNETLVTSDSKSDSSNKVETSLLPKSDDGRGIEDEGGGGGGENSQVSLNVMCSIENNT